MAMLKELNAKDITLEYQIWNESCSIVLSIYKWATISTVSCLVNGGQLGFITEGEKMLVL
jgi:hypothetical protein